MGHAEHHSIIAEISTKGGPQGTALLELLNQSQLFLTPPRRIEQPFPWVQHIPLAFFLVEYLRPQLLVELGTHSGNSYNAFCQAVQLCGSRTSCYAVDTWEGDPHAGAYESGIYDRLAAYQHESYSDFSSLLRTTFDDALPRFSDGSIDFLHIDGLHTYDAVKHDFDSWLPKMAPHGVILMHDIAVREHDFGVWKLWEEIKASYETVEFLHGFGLGIVFLDPKSLRPLKALQELLSQEFVTLLFARLGRNVLLEAETKLSIQMRHELDRRIQLLDDETAKLRSALDRRTQFGISQVAQAQISFDMGSGYSEALTHRIEVETDRVQLVYTPALPLDHPKAVLLIPMNCPALISNLELIVTDIDDTEHTISASGIDNFRVGEDGIVELDSDCSPLFITKNLPSTLKVATLRFDIVATGVRIHQLRKNHLDQRESALQSVITAQEVAFQQRLTEQSIKAEAERIAAIETERRRSEQRDNTRIKELHNEIEAKEREKQELAQKLGQEVLTQQVKEKEIRSLEEQLDRTKADRDAYQQIVAARIRELEGTLNDALTSRSWRITAPIRAIAAGLRALRRNKQGHSAPQHQSTRG